MIVDQLYCDSFIWLLLFMFFLLYDKNTYVTEQEQLGHSLQNQLSWRQDLDISKIQTAAVQPGWCPFPGPRSALNPAKVCLMGWHVMQWLANEANVQGLNDGV